MLDTKKQNLDCDWILFVSPEIDIYLLTQLFNGKNFSLELCVKEENVFGTTIRKVFQKSTFWSLHMWIIILILLWYFFLTCYYGHLSSE